MSSEKECESLIFKNATNTSKFSPRDFDSWIEFWEHFTKQDRPEHCTARPCDYCDKQVETNDRPKIVGAHVVMDSKDWESVFLNLYNIRFKSQQFDTTKEGVKYLNYKNVKIVIKDKLDMDNLRRCDPMFIAPICNTCNHPEKGDFSLINGTFIVLIGPNDQK